MGLNRDIEPNRQQIWIQHKNLQVYDPFIYEDYFEMCGFPLNTFYFSQILYIILSLRGGWFDSLETNFSETKISHNTKRLPRPFAFFQ